MKKPVSTSNLMMGVNRKSTRKEEALVAIERLGELLTARVEHAEVGSAEGDAFRFYLELARQVDKFLGEA